MSIPQITDKFNRTWILGDESGRGGRAEIMNRLGCRWTPSPKGAGSRVAGVSAVHQRLVLKKDGYGAGW